MKSFVIFIQLCFLLFVSCTVNVREIEIKKDESNKTMIITWFIANNTQKKVVLDYSRNEGYNTVDKYKKNQIITVLPLFGTQPDSKLNIVAINKDGKAKIIKNNIKPNSRVFYVQTSDLIWILQNENKKSYISVINESLEESNTIVLDDMSYDGFFTSTDYYQVDGVTYYQNNQAFYSEIDFGYLFQYDKAEKNVCVIRHEIYEK